MKSSPYIGLRPFDSEDAHLFFGRERLVGGLMARLRTTRFICVLGLSGGGKSSLVRAGLIPALKAGYLDWNGTSWDVTMMRPDVNPLEELAKAVAVSEWGKNYLQGQDWKVLLETLRRDPYALASLFKRHPTRKDKAPRLLIVVDQFEELFTRHRSRGSAAVLDAALFVDALIDATTRTDQIYVVTTMRSDRLGDCAEYSDLADAITRGVFLVTRMRPNELADAIEIPARLNNGAVEPELRNYLVQNWNGTSDLPILQHALMRMWEDAQTTSESDRIEITSKHFARCGIEPGASLDRHLDEIYSSLQSDLQPVVEALFRRITRQTSNDEQGYVRDSASVAEIAAIGALDERAHDEMPSWWLRRFNERTRNLTEDNIKLVVEKFRAAGRTFLQASKQSNGEPTSESVIDVTHEAVIKHWKRAKQWAASEGDLARRFQDLCERAKRRDTDGLLSERPDFERSKTWFETTTMWEGGPPLSAQWASRYRDYQDFYDVREFLKQSRELLDRRDLRDAIMAGKLVLADDLIKRQVRLDSGELRELAPLYFAMLPAEIRRHYAERDATSRQADSPQEGIVQSADLKLDQAELEWAFPNQGRSAAGGLTIEHYAAHGGNIQVLERLEALGCTFVSISDHKHTPFHRAALNGQPDAVEWLFRKIDNPALTIHAKDRDGDTALNLAIEGAPAGEYEALNPARVKLITWLLNNGADLTTQNEAKETPLHWAAKQGGAEIVNLLVERDANLLRAEDKGKRTPLHLACDRGRSIDPSRFKAAVALLEAGANIDAKDFFGQTPLITAARNNEERVVRLLLDRNANSGIATEDGVTAVLACLRSQSSDFAFPVLRALIEEGADINAIYSPTGETALHIAVERERAERDLLVQMLLDAKAFVDIEDYRGRTPLSVALAKGQIPNATKFFKRGARLADKSDQDWFIAASAAGARELIGLLIDKGLRGDAKNEAGTTALHAAAEGGQWSALEVLASQRGVDLEVEDATGLTPLRAALIHYNTISAHRLLLCGARMPRGLALETEMGRPQIAVDREGLDRSLRQQLQAGAITGWPFAPLMKAAWSNLDVGAAMDALAPLLQDTQFLARTRTELIDAVRATPLASIAGGTLFEVRMAREQGPLGYLTFIQHRRGYSFVDEKFLKDGRLNPEDVELVSAFSVDGHAAAEEFVRLYCGALAIDLGVLTPIESPGDGLLNVPSPSPDFVQRVDQAARPIVLERASDGSGDLWAGNFVAQYGPELWHIDVVLTSKTECRLSGDPIDRGPLPYRRSTYSNGIRVVTED